jgi:hypothetical protein
MPITAEDRAHFSAIVAGAIYDCAEKDIVRLEVKEAKSEKEY